MRVKMTRLECGPDGTYQPGDERDVTEAHGQTLIDSGCAFSLDPIVHETATLPAPETAVSPETKPSKRK